jgi:hypothetical protein
VEDDPDGIPSHSRLTDVIGLCVLTRLIHRDVAIQLGASAGGSHGGGTPASLTILAGSLSITVPTGPVNLGSRANTVSSGTISGPLGQVQVNDARSGSAGWVVSVISGDFTPTSGAAIPAAALSYTVGTITKVGTATYAANDPANLEGQSVAITATGVTGDNSATWNPTIHVVVPGGMAAGVYSATITHSVV